MKISINTFDIIIDTTAVTAFAGSKDIFAFGGFM